MKRDEIGRREVVKSLAVGSAAIVPLGSLLAAASTFKPRFLTVTQAELVATLAEMIIPQTDTPGARAVRAQELTDLILSEETADIQKRFLEGLAWVDQKSQTLHGRDFLKLTSEHQTAIMTSMATPQNDGHEFFEEIRKRTVFAYYTSEIGIHQELNYQGHQVLDHWPGCPHPDHHGDSD